MGMELLWLIYKKFSSLVGLMGLIDNLMLQKYQTN